MSRERNGGWMRRGLARVQNQNETYASKIATSMETNKARVNSCWSALTTEYMSHTSSLLSALSSRPFPI
jgi:hypothetical protein